MPNTYNIYLVNQSDSLQTFWLFLQPPEELASDPKVFANSNASLAIRPNQPGLNSFGVPVQYVVGAGASNQAVGLNIQITSSVTQNAALQDVWDAKYYDAPPKQGPDLSKDQSKSGPNSIAIVSNPFNKQNNENLNWYSNQSFGIETDAGFIGMTWSPNPNQKRTLTPKLAFYVAVGNFGANELADWTDVSNSAAEILVPDNFDHLNCTVIYTPTGEWEIVPGKPTSSLLSSNILSNLVLSHLALSTAHADLVSLVVNSPDIRSSVPALAALTDQEDDLVSVKWDKAELVEIDATLTETHLTGTVSVQTALGAAFAVFVLSGIKFTVTSNTQGKKTVSFSYQGIVGAQAIKDLFVAGAQLFFKNS